MKCTDAKGRGRFVATQVARAWPLTAQYLCARSSAYRTLKAVVCLHAHATLRLLYQRALAALRSSYPSLSPPPALDLHLRLHLHLRSSSSSSLRHSPPHLLSLLSLLRRAFILIKPHCDFRRDAHLQHSMLKRLCAPTRPVQSRPSYHVNLSALQPTNVTPDRCPHFWPSRALASKRLQQPL